MSDYTLIDEALKYGARVSEVGIDPAFLPFIVHANPSKPPKSEKLEPKNDDLEPSKEDPPCHTLHIRPFVEYRAGASLLKTCKGGQGRKPVGGERKPIKGFSKSARRRLLQTIAGIRLDAPFPFL